MSTTINNVISFPKFSRSSIHEAIADWERKSSDTNPIYHERGLLTIDAERSDAFLAVVGAALIVLVFLFHWTDEDIARQAVVQFFSKFGDALAAEMAYRLTDEVQSAVFHCC